MIYDWLFLQSGEEPNIEEEMGLVGAVADDAEAEYIRKMVETDVVTGKKLNLSDYNPSSLLHESIETDITEGSNQVIQTLILV